ncbi:MAG: metalloregulator ArsR/SmtB family transcription factor [Alphaproteobacteria bacterium]
MTALRAGQLKEMERNAAHVADVLRALSSEARLLILCELGEGELSVGEINARVELSQSALSQHLAKLRAEGLVATRREAQAIYYRIADARVGALISALHDIYCRSRKER